MYNEEEAIKKQFKPVFKSDIGRFRTKRLSTLVTEDEMEFVKIHIKGKYKNVSDYLRMLIAKDLIEYNNQTFNDNSLDT